MTLTAYINARSLIIHGVGADGALLPSHVTACGIRVRRPRSWSRSPYGVRCRACRAAAEMEALSA